MWNLVSYGILCPTVTFWMTLLMNMWTNVVMDGGWVHPLAKTLHLSATCDEILSWMTEIWMKNHLVSIIFLQHCKPITPPKKFFLQGMTNNVGLTFSVGDTLPQFTISTEQIN